MFINSRSKIFKDTFFFTNNSKILVQGKLGVGKVLFPEKKLLKICGIFFISKDTENGWLKINTPWYLTGAFGLLARFSFFFLKKETYKLFQGVSVGFLIKLKIKGVGFKAKLYKMLNESFLFLGVGYNHDINIKIPPNIMINIIKETSLIITSCSFADTHLFIGFLNQCVKGK